MPLRRNLADLSHLEEKIIARAQTLETQVRDAFDLATAGKPVEGAQRPRADTDLLYAHQDPGFLSRIQAMGPFLTSKERAAENRRSLRTGGYLVFPEDVG